jgi:hypothetical protein
MCRTCEQSRAAILELLKGLPDPDGELQGAWEFDGYGWTCPWCHLRTGQARSEFPLRVLPIGARHRRRRRR